MRDSPSFLLHPCYRLAAISGALVLAGGLVWSRPPTKSKSPDKAVESDHSARMARGLEMFKKQVRPVLVQQCLKCHSGETPEAGLDLTTREGLLKGGDFGPAIIPGDAKNSLLYRLTTHTKKRQQH